MNMKVTDVGGRGFFTCSKSLMPSDVDCIVVIFTLVWAILLKQVFFHSFLTGDSISVFVLYIYMASQISPDFNIKILFPILTTGEM